MVGLSSGTQLKIAVIGGILTIAIADSFSDAIGIHVSEESECKHTSKEIWQSTIATFISKFFFAISFIIPVLYFKDLSTAIFVSIVWGLMLLSVLTYFISKGQNKKPWRAIGEHVIIAIVVIILTHYTGQWIAQTFC
jgi:VIT1/CCC1 family predicted Fe2+/Mn2+ transporter